MNTKPGRTCLILALLSLSPAAAVPIDLDARHNGVAVQAPIAGMQLQGDAEVEDEGSVAPDADEGDKTVTCTQRASHCVSPKQELALVLSGDRPLHEGKSFVTPGDKAQPKSND